MCDGTLEKGLQNRLNEEVIVVDESAMIPTSNIKGAAQAKCNILLPDRICSV